MTLEIRKCTFQRREGQSDVGSQEAHTKQMRDGLSTHYLVLVADMDRY